MSSSLLFTWRGTATECSLIIISKCSATGLRFQKPNTEETTSVRLTRIAELSYLLKNKYQGKKITAGKCRQASTYRNRNNLFLIQYKHIQLFIMMTVINNVSKGSVGEGIQLKAVFAPTPMEHRSVFARATTVRYIRAFYEFRNPRGSANFKGEGHESSISTR